MILRDLRICQERNGAEICECVGQKERLYVCVALIRLGQMFPCKAHFLGLGFSSVCLDAWMIQAQALLCRFPERTELNFHGMFASEQQYDVCFRLKSNEMWEGCEK